MLQQEEYNEKGYAMCRDLLSAHDVSDLLHTLNEQGVFTYHFTNAEAHNLFRSQPIVHELATSQKFTSIAKSILGPGAQPFYAIMLDKTRTTNWGLDWHQDLKIAVKHKADVPGYSNWSQETGIWHVVPPEDILENMLAIRLHLDDCDDTNGALWAIQGSQKEGVIAVEQIAGIVNKGLLIDCHAKVGDAMLMSPLLLHKSPYSVSDRPRRVLQIEYRSTALHGGLEWHN